MAFAQAVKAMMYNQDIQYIKKTLFVKEANTVNGCIDVINALISSSLEIEFENQGVKLVISEGSSFAEKMVFKDCLLEVSKNLIKPLKFFTSLKHLSLQNCRMLKPHHSLLNMVAWERLEYLEFTTDGSDPVQPKFVLGRIKAVYFQLRSLRHLKLHFAD